ncbi:MAG: hypothetical protein ACRDBG_25995 [Waterburya sp.]
MIQNLRPIYSRLPDCYKTEGIAQILNPDFYETKACLFEQFDDRGLSTVTNLTFSGELNRTRYLYLVNYENAPVIQAVEYGLQLPSQYVVIPDREQFNKNPPKYSVADWYTRYFDNLTIEKYSQVQRFFKDYLDYDYTLSPWLIQFSTGDLFSGITFRSLDDLNWVLRYFHSNEVTNEEYWVYTQIEDRYNAPIAAPFGRPVLHYNLTTGQKTLVSTQLNTGYQVVDLIENSPIINEIVFDWGTQPTVNFQLESTEVRAISNGNETVIAPSGNTTNNVWRSRGLPSNSEWMGILGSKGSSDTLHFVLNALGYYGHRSVDLTSSGTMFVRSVNCVVRPLTLWRIPALTVEEGENVMVADMSVASDRDTFSKSFVRLPLSIPREPSPNNPMSLRQVKQLVQLLTEKDSTEVSYAYFAADISLAEEPVFDSDGILDSYYLQY